MLPGMTIATLSASAQAGLSTATPAAVPHMATKDLLLMIIVSLPIWPKLRHGSFSKDCGDSLDQDLLIVDIK
jgi:hypothetical protein